MEATHNKGGPQKNLGPSFFIAKFFKERADRPAVKDLDDALLYLLALWSSDAQQVPAPHQLKTRAPMRKTFRARARYVQYLPTRESLAYSQTAPNTIHPTTPDVEKPSGECPAVGLKPKCSLFLPRPEFHKIGTAGRPQRSSPRSGSAKHASNAVGLHWNADSRETAPT